jgi:hypothetical protein
MSEKNSLIHILILSFRCKSHRSISHRSSLFKYCDIVIKHCYKLFSMFSLSMFGPFQCSVPFEVRSFDIQSFDVRSHSTFSLSMFGPIRDLVLQCSVLFDVQSFEVRSFQVQSFEVRSFEVLSFEVLSFEVQSQFLPCHPPPLHGI